MLKPPGTTRLKLKIDILLLSTSAFQFNLRRDTTEFHALDGSGYRFLGDMVLTLDKTNGSVAARMVGGFTRWRKYDTARQAGGEGSNTHSTHVQTTNRLRASV
jgi:aminopeptidase N